MDKRNIQDLAEKIAVLLARESGSERNVDDFVRESLQKINNRLDTIEARLETSSQPPLTTDSSIKNHPSVDKILNLEELADEIISAMGKEKACPYEPAGKPCDDCAMCNTRGF